MQAHLLLRMADKLEAWVAEQSKIKFDLIAWGNLKVTSDDRLIECGSSACAIGLAALRGWFDREGLQFDVQQSRVFDRLVLIPRYYGCAIARRSGDFSISRTRTFNIFFYSGSYGDQKGSPAALAVAKRIREFVASGGRHAS